MRGTDVARETGDCRNENDDDARETGGEVKRSTDCSAATVSSASESDDVRRANGDYRFACTDHHVARNNVAQAVSDGDAESDDSSP